MSLGYDDGNCVRLYLENAIPRRGSFACIVSSSREGPRVRLVPHVTSLPPTVILTDVSL